MAADDHPAMIELMRRSPGVSVRDADTPEGLARFLVRNPGLSFVAESDGRLVGCLMGGHDGRRGHLHHLAVDAGHRRRGIASALVERCLSALERQGIHKTHIDVYRNNAAGNGFWENAGWSRRDDTHRFSIARGGRENA
ncbi:MAG: GNAT family N-acetyltransferase [Candidatus Accumulibacter sp.]|jgi:ribosomal protein S18 acetylase RimI-like enzyme|nr:GNAT family N-acetyltransferase [Accumulibacter sp.]